MKTFIHLYAALILFRAEKDMEKADQLAKELVAMLAVHKQTISETLLEEFEIHLRNHWTHRYNYTRKEEFPPLLHELQLRQIERLRHNEEGIAASHLNNIMLTAMKLKKIDWATEVLGWLGPRIIDPKAELIYLILLTYPLYEQKQYAAAAQILPHFITYGELRNMVFYNIAAKLDIKIRYEMNTLLEEDHFNMFRATQIRVQRDKSLTVIERERRKRFFPLAMKLYRAKDYLRHNPRANIEKRLQEVRDALQDASKPVSDVDWLKEKLIEFDPPKTGNK